MSLLDLGALYVLGGVVCAVGVWQRGGGRRTPMSLLTSLVLWPLWAPFVFSETGKVATRRRAKRKRKAARERTDERKTAAPRSVTVATLLDALEEAVGAARGTPFAAMLNEDAAERIALEVNAACDRLCELEAVLAEPGFDLQHAEARVRTLSEDGASKATQSAARVHLHNVRRLVKLRIVQAAALYELEQALAALHSQLVVAQYAGSTGVSVGAIVSDLWARVEGLGEALETDVTAPEQEAC
jgi:hypothetical protein